MKKQFLLLLVLCISVAQFNKAQAQEEAEKDFTVKWNGYVKGDYILDTRRSVEVRENQYFYLPLGEDLDANGDDRNAEFGYTSSAIETRLKASFSGPDFLGMKTAGVIEAHFFGGNNGSINNLGLRNAFFTLSNDKVEWLFGQFWIPGFVLNVSPGTHAFNAGAPYQPFARSPQIRFSTKGNVRFTAALLSERDFASATGRLDYGGAGARFSGIPTVHAQVQFGSDDTFVAGAGFTYKTVDLNDRLEDPDTGVNLTLAEDENVSSLSFLAYAKAQLGEGVTWKVYGQYGGNTTEQLNVGAYGVDSNGDYYDAKVLSAWTEFSGKFDENWGWGVFGGYTKNNGFGEDNIVGSVFNSDIESSYRVSPRFDYTVGKVRFGCEFEYTTAQYISGIDANGGDLLTTGVDEVANFRTNFSATFSF